MVCYGLVRRTETSLTTGKADDAPIVDCTCCDRCRNRELDPCLLALVPLFDYAFGVGEDHLIEVALHLPLHDGALKNVSQRSESGESTVFHDLGVSGAVGVQRLACDFEINLDFSTRMRVDCPVGRVHSRDLPAIGSFS